MKLSCIFGIAVLALFLGACTGQTTSNGQRERPTDTADTGTEDGDVADTGSPDTGSATDSGVDASSDGGSQEPDAGTQDAEPDAPLDKGTSIGTFWNTYYYLADESGYDGADDTTLYNDSCEPIAEVPGEFADDACIEGSARLEDGVVINYHSPCSCGPCSFCWAEMDPNTHPWGMGSRGNALEPLRSWAVDTDELAHGTVVYVEAWDGVEIPQVGELGGFTHDGCFRADDVGGGIDGKHFDFFAGTPAMWQALEAIFPTRTDFTVYVDSPRCAQM